MNFFQFLSPNISEHHVSEFKEAHRSSRTPSMSDTITTLAAGLATLEHRTEIIKALIFDNFGRKANTSYLPC